MEEHLGVEEVKHRKLNVFDALVFKVAHFRQLGRCLNRHLDALFECLEPFGEVAKGRHRDLSDMVDRGFVLAVEHL